MSSKGTLRFRRASLAALAAGLALAGCSAILGLDHNYTQGSGGADASAGKDGGDATAGGGGSAGDASTPIEPVTIKPVYPKNGVNWNDYVENDGPDTESASDTACTGDETGLYSACIEGGEKRKIVLHSRTSCAGLTVNETLGAFNWICKDNGGGPVVFYTTGLKPGHGLRDLLNAKGFKPNVVTIMDGSNAVARTGPSWSWNNPVRAAPDSSAGMALLNKPGVIYYLASPQDSDGYNITADKVSLVGAAGATLTYGTATANNCNTSTGEGSSPNAICLVAAGSRKFLWLEVDLKHFANATPYLLFLANTVFSRVNDSTFVGASGWGSGGLLELADQSAHNSVETASVQAADSDGVMISNSQMNTLDNVTVVGSRYEGVRLANATGNVVRNVSVAENDVGVKLDDDFGNGSGSNGNWLEHIRSADNRLFGVQIESSASNTLYDVVASNTQAVQQYTGNGFRLYGSKSQHNVITQLLVANSDAEGVLVGGSAHFNTLSHVTTVNNVNNTGFLVLDAYSNTVVQLLSVNNDGGGFGTYGTNGDNHDNLFADLYVANNPGSVGQAGAVDHVFTGQLWLGNGGQCSVDSTGSRPGLINNTCADAYAEGANTYAGQLSDAVLHIGRDLTSSFVGKVTVNDTANSSDSSGVRQQDAITDWLNFDTPFRTWGKDGPAFPAAGNRGACVSGDSCRIWDWRLWQKDTEVDNVNGAFTSGATCPASVRGDVAAQGAPATVVEDHAALPYSSGINAVETLGDGIGNDNGVCEPNEVCHNRFLINAVEIIGDGIGDDDGLCESNEACIYSPNIGAYQGEGKTLHKCIYKGSLVKNVTMYAYANPGAPRSP